jgi:hypothetical protein
MLMALNFYPRMRILGEVCGSGTDADKDLADADTTLFIRAGVYLYAVW